jgi:hypothetical protein
MKNSGTKRTRSKIILELMKVVSSPETEQLEPSTKTTEEILGMIVKREKRLDSPAIWLDTLESMIQHY